MLPFKPQKQTTGSGDKSTSGGVDGGFATSSDRKRCFDPSLDDLKKAQWNDAVRSNFKSMRECTMKSWSHKSERVKIKFVLELKAKDGTPENVQRLTEEVQVLRDLENLGVRVARILHVDWPKGGENADQPVVYMKKINGNLVDFKSTDIGYLYSFVWASMFNLCFKGSNTEWGQAKVFGKIGDFMDVFDEAVKENNKPEELELPTPAAIDTAINDFTRIQKVLAKYYVSDLQGIMEVKCGKFHVIDPGALHPKNKETMENATESQGYNHEAAENNVSEIIKKLKELRSQIEKVEKNA